MAIVQCSDVWLSSDRRFRRWGKTILSETEIDLGQTNGYSLRGNFVRWDEAIALKPGQFLVLAAEAGSRNHHSYRYAVVGIDDNDQPVVVPASDIADAVQKSTLSDSIKAAARNSELYQIAAYCYLQFQSRQSDELSAEELALVEKLRGLPADRRQAVLKALG